MGRGRKLERFAEIKTFNNVFEPDGKRILSTDFGLRGKWNEEYFGNQNPIIIELGCGKGEYTVGLARKYPDRNFIGLDIKGARMWKGAKFAYENKLPNAAFVRTRIEFIERIFAAEEISEIWITFPDPYPKKPNNRLSSSIFLNRYSKILKNNGIVHLKTDSRQLYNYTLSVLEASSVKAESSSDDIYASGDPEDENLALMTFYEKMFLDEGKPITYLRFRIGQDDKFIETDKPWE